MSRLGSQLIKTVSLVGCGVFSFLLYKDNKKTDEKIREARENEEEFKYSEMDKKRDDSNTELKTAGLLASMVGVTVGSMLLRNNDNLDSRNIRLERVSEAILNSKFDTKEEEKEKNV